ncbi:S8 family peptidase [Streptomyces pinistramenti]|uniref:S8 family peptidase n=1 Tax=Streptomyces pinistramenti TaxID=2884812 RepID=UPI001D06FBA3|nr:S8 family serine peptidase [Streptomyces pinistramenti]MCB5908215.1 S8 family serine peptidase [Streptomyces pinistramenti]
MAMRSGSANGSFRLRRRQGDGADGRNGPGNRTRRGPAAARTGLGAAVAIVLATALAVPSQAQPAAGTDGQRTRGARPITGSPAAAGKGPTAATVTLVTGDRVQLRTDAKGRSSAAVLPRADGSRPAVQTRQSGKDLYVYPDAAAEALARGRVDEELFNVSGLVRQGYDDAHRATLPLIATYGESVDVTRAAPAVPRGAKRGTVLGVIDGVALSADKKRADDFWQDLGAGRARAAGGLRKLWLDRKVHGTLDRSTKQVNAPKAWAAGLDGKGTEVAVLDTGVDAEHPDLKGRITDSKNFTDDTSTDDVQGHGTHTASTVGGSGAASGGRKKGVAPGTGLLIGKVLDDTGSGTTSWIISGMQWAVDRHADVVSMSLGSPEATDCTDPMGQAAQEFSKNTTTLFVVAAGNAGPAKSSVSSPGCAPGVLTVGAVDRDESTAPFSSRGPVLTTHTLKPEIAAPGVGISAASAGGRGALAYRAMSGTSMATPHVAGAAAVVRQAHPDWTAQQVKSALVSSAQNGAGTGAAKAFGGADEIGAGRLDVAAAATQPVLAAPAVQGGSFSWPQDPSDRTSVDVPYTNTTAEDVRLKLTLDEVHGNDGSTVTSAPARIGASRVTVPAGQTVTVPLKLDPAAHLTKGQYGDLSGRVLATAAHGVRVTVPFTLYVQPQTVTLRVKMTDRAGAAAAGGSALDVVSTDTATGERRVNDGADEQLFHLRPGAYLISGFIETGTASLSYLAHPEYHLTKDTTLVLDARRAHRLTVRTDRTGEARRTVLSYGRWWDDTWLTAGTASTAAAGQEVYASVNGRSHKGGYGFSSSWRSYGTDTAKGAGHGTAAGQPYVYNLTFPENGPIASARTYRVRDKDLATVRADYHALGKPADYQDLLAIHPSWSPQDYVDVGLFDPVHAPGTRTEFYTPGGTTWQHSVLTSMPFGALLTDRNRSYRAGQQRTEQWFGGVLRPTAPLNEDGSLQLAAERQGNLMGFGPGFWNDGSGDHWSPGASFGDIGNLELRRDGQPVGTSPFPNGVFEVPPAEATYTLRRDTQKIPTSDPNWLRSQETSTTWTFRSHLEENVESRGLPLLFPDYGVPVDGNDTLPAADGQRITLTADGHAGYTPGALTKAALSYSYDGGKTWTAAPTAQHDGRWTATVDHAGAAGKQVTLKAELTDSHGNAVSQTVVRAYDVR